MTMFLSNLISGISLGSVYAIIALGYTMVYGIAKMLNFAHGDIIMVGAYICFTCLYSLGLPPVAGVLACVIVCTLLLSIQIGLIKHREAFIVFGPHERKGLVVLMERSVEGRQGVIESDLPVFFCHLEFCLLV